MIGCVSNINEKIYKITDIEIVKVKGLKSDNNDIKNIIKEFMMYNNMYYASNYDLTKSLSENKTKEFSNNKFRYERFQFNIN